jgi:DNA-binding XRE family transcriptional regulator
VTGYMAWNEIRAEQVARAGGEAAVEAGKREMLGEVIGHRLAEARRARGLTQQQVADRMGVSKGRISQIETRQGLRTRRLGTLCHCPGRPASPGDLLR